MTFSAHENTGVEFLELTIKIFGLILAILGKTECFILSLK